MKGKSHKMKGRTHNVPIVLMIEIWKLGEKINMIKRCEKYLKPLEVIFGFQNKHK